MVLNNVKQVLKSIEERDFKHIYFVACGGSLALMTPSKYLVDLYAKKLTADAFNSNEFIYLNPAALGKDSAVILCSQEGKTPETVAAAKFAKEKGATVITLSMVDYSELGNEGEFAVKYGYYETADAIDTSYGAMYLLTAGIIEAQENCPLFNKMVTNLTKITPIINKAKEDFVDKALDFAESCKNSKVLYTLASGSDFSQAYVFSNCYMMEMQWINAIAIHAGEFFHGPFEILEKDSSVVLLMGKDNTRFLEERALKFCSKYVEKIFVIDMNEVDFKDIDEDFVGVMAPLVINNVCRLYSKTIAKVRNHSLDIRRYMHIVEY
ncbi:MAG: SIS domain-containing protein [Herbinix sp.]|nr:SIS domain-containing protein [Herbinix sp.]